MNIRLMLRLVPRLQLLTGEGDLGTSVGIERKHLAAQCGVLQAVSRSEN